MMPEVVRRINAIGTSVGAWAAIAWVAFFMLAPLGIMLVFSFWRYSQFTLQPDFTLENYKTFFQNPIYLRVLGRTILISIITTCTAVALAYPIALFLHRMGRTFAGVFVVLIIIPLWINDFVRNFAFYGVFGRTGFINSIVTALGFEPIELMFTIHAVVAVAVYLLLPYAIIALYSSVEKISPSLLEAAQDLGAGPWQSFRRITFPLSWSGLQAAIFFVFIPSLGLFLTPRMIGGDRVIMMGNLIAPIIFDTLDFARGSAFAIILLAIVLFFAVVFGRFLNLEQLYSGGAGKSSARRSERKISSWFFLWASAVLLFLYVPIFLVVIFSFDKNGVGTFPLQGYTLDWYRVLFADEGVRTALKNSIIIALATAGVSVLIAAPAAYTVVRSRFVGRDLLRTLILIPIVVPELLLAVGIFLLLTRLGVPLSTVTVILGHVTYTLPFVFFVILAQQYGFEKSVEEAAHDLGANAWQTFRHITLPLMLPAILGGGILAFTLSLNNFVTAFMLSGTTATLPMVMFSMLRTPTHTTFYPLSSVLIGGALCVVLVSVIIVAITKAREPSILPGAGRSEKIPE